MPAPTFATVADVVAQYGDTYVSELAGGNGMAFDPADPDDTVTRKVQGKLDDFAAEVDAALRKHYGQGHAYDRTNTLLRSYTVQGALLYLMQGTKAGLDDKGREDLERLDNKLESLAAGRVSLEVADPDAPAVLEDAFRGRDRLFARPAVAEYPTRPAFRSAT